MGTYVERQGWDGIRISGWKLQGAGPALLVPPAVPASLGHLHPPEMWVLHPSEMWILQPSEMWMLHPSEMWILHPSEIWILHPLEMWILHPSEIWILHLSIYQKCGFCINQKSGFCIHQKCGFYIPFGGWKHPHSLSWWLRCLEHREPLPGGETMTSMEFQLLGTQN